MDIDITNRGESIVTYLYISILYPQIQQSLSASIIISISELSLAHYYLFQQPCKHTPKILQQIHSLVFIFAWKKLFLKFSYTKIHSTVCILLIQNKCTVLQNVIHQMIFSLPLVGWGRDYRNEGFVDQGGIKFQLVNLVTSVQTLLRGQYTCKGKQKI